MLYREHGYAPIPVRPNSKAPLIADWSRFSDQLPDAAQVDAWAKQYPRAGIAIATGPASGIVALDLDHDDGSHPAILEAAGPSPVGKRGARGATYFYRFSGERSQAFRRNGETICEILGPKRLVIIPPTIHPDTGRAYEWTTPARLINVHPSQLPPLNAAGVAALFKEPDRKPQRSRRATPRTTDHSGDAELIAQALSHIPADLDRHSWIRIGMAIKAALGDAGFQLWNDWSSTAPGKYDASQMEAQWRSFEAEGGISPGTLFYFAKQHGWTPPARAQRHQR